MITTSEESIVPTFETERIILRGIKLEDAASYQKHFNDYAVISQLSAVVPWPYPEDGAESFIRHVILPKQGKDRWFWGIFLKERPAEMIGGIDLWREGIPENRGFWLGKDFWGKGLMTEAVSPVMDYAYTVLGFEKLVFSNALGNIKSRRIKEKTGARLIGTREAKFVNPKLTEAETWELTKEEWDLHKSMHQKLVLIGDSRVKAVPVVECHEPIVDLLVEFPQLKFDLQREYVQKESESISMARKSIGEKLVKAQSLLPSGIRLLVKECYRPLAIQRSFWDGYSAFLRKKSPDWSEAKIYDECSKLNAPLDVAPHSTGGAVDLTLIDSKGVVLDLGTKFNASPLDTAGATYTKAENISDIAKAHRNVLTSVMSSAGFVNYPTEWWHWSYGDKYWALLSGAPHAIYDSKDL